MMELDAQQRTVVNAGPSERLLVEACPGAGKTLVACRRIARLVREGMPPSSVLVISFTRTAVAEVRARIASALGDLPGRANVRVATLDSQTYVLLHGFPEDRRDLFSGYEENIATLTRRLTSGGDDLRDYLGDLNHLVIDEAQDLTGPRADLALALIGAVRPGCGVTVLADPAQAIYGFTVDPEERGAGPSFLERVRTVSPGLRPLRLETVHRTDNPRLLDLFVSGWALATEPKLSAPERARAMVRRIQYFADAVAPESETDFAGAGNPADLLLLYRSRMEVCAASSRMLAAGQPHRLRTSHLPTVRAPWIASVLGSARDPRISKSSFIKLFETGRRFFAPDSLSAAACFELLRGHAPGGRDGIDLDKLRAVLARGAPPPELCTPELGTHGPVLSTVHASKGREAALVRYVLGSPWIDGASPDTVDEEARVCYVAATRARNCLQVVRRRTTGSSRCASGRRYRYLYHRPGTPAQIEIGLAGDVVFLTPAQSPIGGGDVGADAVQERLAHFDGTPVVLIAENDGPPDFAYSLKTSDGLVIAKLADRVNKDLFMIRSGRSDTSRDWNALPRRFGPTYLVAVATAMDAEAGSLGFPYDISGLFLAPVVRGLPLVSFAGRD